MDADVSGAVGGGGDTATWALRPRSDAEAKDRGSLRSGGARGPRTPRGDVAPLWLDTIVMNVLEGAVVLYKRK